MTLSLTLFLFDGSKLLSLFKLLELVLESLFDWSDALEFLLLVLLLLRLLLTFVVACFPFKDGLEFCGVIRGLIGFAEGGWEGDCLVAFKLIVFEG